MWIMCAVMTILAPPALSCLAVIGVLLFVYRSKSPFLRPLKLFMLRVMKKVLRLAIMPKLVGFNLSNCYSSSAFRRSKRLVGRVTSAQKLLIAFYQAIQTFPEVYGVALPRECTRAPPLPWRASVRVSCDACMRRGV